MAADTRGGRLGRITHVVGLGIGCLLLAACANQNVANRAAPGPGVSFNTPASERMATRATPRRRSVRSLVRRRASHRGGQYSAIGLASWYGPRFHGRRTADGETFDMNSLTAAHRTLPLPCRVRVTNLANRRSIIVRVNDRGPYVGRRVIDVSAKTAKVLGFYHHGVAKVKVDYIGRAPLKDAVYRRSAGG
jgi:rare lipoprotein A